VSSGGRRRGHFQHETTDAFAEGWDAREKGVFLATQNPYRVELDAILAKKAKRTERQLEALRRNVELWEQGWTESAEALEDAKKGKI
jgi:hypothetical protein